MKLLVSLVKKPIGNIVLIGAIASAAVSPSAYASHMEVLQSGEKIYRAVCSVIASIDKGVVAVVSVTSGELRKKMAYLIEEEADEKLGADAVESLAQENNDHSSKAQSWAPPHMFKY